MNIKKRDGTIVPFVSTKIHNAIYKALEAIGLPSDSTADKVTGDVVSMIGQADSISVEEVQDLVETALMKRGLNAAAKAYILYRDAHARARNALHVRKRMGSKQSVTDRSMLISENADEQVAAWNRKALEKRLMDTCATGQSLAQEIGKRVETCIINSGLTDISNGLVREMTNNVIRSMGYPFQLVDDSVYTVPVEFVDNLIESKVNENSNIQANNPEAVGQSISEFVLKKFALSRVFTDRVRAAHDEGFVYVHDLGFPVRAYCSSHSIEYIKKYGLKGINTLRTTSKPARSASVLTGHINTFLASMQAYYAGALGLGFVNVFYAPYMVGMDCSQRHQIAQEFIFNMSQNAFSRGGQTLFIDANIHTGVPGYLKNVPAIGPGGKYMWLGHGSGKRDWRPLEEFKDDSGAWCLRNDDGEVLLREVNGVQTMLYDETEGKILTYGDFAEETQDFAHALLDVWDDGDANGHVFEFPKCDFHVSAETFTDPEQTKVYEHACKVAAHNGSPYFVFDRDAVSLASCCFTGDTPTLTKGGDGSKIHLMTFKELYDSSYREAKANLSVYHNGGWSMAKLLKLSGKGKRIFKITTVNNKEQKVTEDHIVPTYAGDKPASQVTEDDYILFSTTPAEGTRANTSTGPKSKLSYAQGIVIGAYLGDGSIEQRLNQRPAVHFSLNEEKYNQLRPWIEQAMHEWDVDGVVTLHAPYNNVYPVYISSWGLKERIRDWISGDYCYEKCLDIGCLKESLDFRRGIVDGLYITDGGNSNRIYSTSINQITVMEALFTSLGIQTIIDVSDRTGEGKVVIRGEEFNRNYPVFCIRWYENGTRRQYPSIYVTRNNSVFYKVASVEELPEEDDVYCFQITDNNEPYFTLPSGIITHNCRLRVQVTDMSLLKHPEHLRTLGLQNVTINIPQCAYRAAGKGNATLEGILEQIGEAMDIAVEAHLQKRAFLSSIMKPGCPMAQVGAVANDGRPYIDLDTAMYIIGIIGVNDAVHYLLGKEMHESEEAMDMALKITGWMFLRCKEYTKKYGITFKLEETPAESASRKLAKSDLVHWHDAASKVYKGGDEDHAYYTNSIHLAPDAPVDLLERIDKQAMFNSIIEAGAITHAFIGEQQPDWRAVSLIIEQAFQRTQSAQIVFSPEFTYCRKCGKTTRGLVPRCPECGSDDVDGETRIVGYYSYVRGWNLSKLAELRARQHGDYMVTEGGAL